MVHVLQMPLYTNSFIFYPHSDHDQSAAHTLDEPIFVPHGQYDTSVYTSNFESDVYKLILDVECR